MNALQRIAQCTLAIGAILLLGARTAAAYPGGGGGGGKQNCAGD